MTLQVEILSKAEIEQVWKTRARAENFAEYVAFLSPLDIGASFRVSVGKGTDSAAVIRHNFNEAAKERVKAQRDPEGKILLKDGKIVPITVEGKPVLDPIILRWKTDSHEEKRTTKAKDGKPATETAVKVIDKMTALLAATDSVKKRGPRKPKTDAPAASSSTADGTGASTQSGGADVSANGTSAVAASATS